MLLYCTFLKSNSFFRNPLMFLIYLEIYFSMCVYFGGAVKIIFMRLQRRSSQKLQLKSNFNLHSHIPRRNEHLTVDEVLTRRTWEEPTASTHLSSKQSNSIQYDSIRFDSGNFCQLEFVNWHSALSASTSLFWQLRVPRDSQRYFPVW